MLPIARCPLPIARSLLAAACWRTVPCYSLVVPVAVCAWLVSWLAATVARLHFGLCPLGLVALGHFELLVRFNE